MVSNVFGCAFRKIRLILNIKDANYHLGIDLSPLLKEKHLLTAILSSKFSEMDKTMIGNSTFLNQSCVSPNRSLLKY